MADASGKLYVSQSSGDVNIIWTIRNFKYLETTDSEVFSLFQAEWFLRVCPFYDPCVFRLFLRRKSFVNTPPFDHVFRIAFTVGKKNCDCLEYYYNFNHFIFRKDYESSPRIHLENEELEINIREIFSVPGTVEIMCTLSLLNNIVYKVSNALSKYSTSRIRETLSPLDDFIDMYSEEEIEPSTTPSSYFSDTSSEEEIIPSTLKPPDCLRTSSEEECAIIMSMPHGIQTLSQNFKELLDTGRNADVTIKVKEQTFQAHQLILESRSSVLASMFQHDMKEKRSKVINVDDCHPDSFKDFLLYLYTGKVDHIMASSSSSIYPIADKYNVKELIDVCRDYMINNMSVNSFCDIVLIATMHNEEELMKTAIEYFIRHAEDILQSQGWQAFLPEHVTVANELLQKLFLRDNEYRIKMRRYKTCRSRRTR